MKFYLFAFIILIAAAATFLSCNNDSPVGTSTPSENYYNWSIVSEGLEGITSISTGSSNVLFASGIKSYRIANGIRTEINFHDEKFTPVDVKAYDENYAVFLGYKSFPSDTAFFKIYSDGTVKSYSLALKQRDFLNEVFILGKDKFYTTNEGPITWYEFNKGVFTEHTLPNNHSALKFTKMNNEIYLISKYENNAFNVFFKIENGAAVEVRTEAPDGKLFFLNNDIIKVIEEDLSVEFYNYTGTGWSKFYNSYSNTNGERTVYINGDTKDFFSVITLDNQYNFHGNVWNGKEYEQQDNFPSGLTSFNTLGKASNYNDGAFYFYHSEVKKLFKAVKNN